MRTPVYVKMDARDPLLLSEGVCHQLGIIRYHPSVGADLPVTQSSSDSEARIPVVRVKLIHSVRIPPMKSTVVPVQLVGDRPAHGLALLEPLCGDDFPQFASSFVKIDEQGCCNMMITNPTGFTQKLEEGTIVGEAVDAECVSCDSAVNCDQSDSGVVGEGLEGSGGSGGEAVGVLGDAGGKDGTGGSGGGGGAGGSGAGGGGVGGKVEEVSGGEEGRPRTIRRD